MDVSTVWPKTIAREGWPMTSSSNVGASGLDDANEASRRWLDLESDGRLDALCFERCLSSSLRLLLRPLPLSTARGPLPSRRYDFWLESDIAS